MMLLIAADNYMISLRVPPVFLNCVSWSEEGLIAFGAESLVELTVW